LNSNLKNEEGRPVFPAEGTASAKVLGWERAGSIQCVWSAVKKGKVEQDGAGTDTDLHESRESHLLVLVPMLPQDH
jgi:hypothetical protein